MDSPGKNIGVGCHALLQGIFQTQGSSLSLLRLLHRQAGSLPLAPPEKCSPLLEHLRFYHFGQGPGSCWQRAVECGNWWGEEGAIASLHKGGSTRVCVLWSRCHTEGHLAEVHSGPEATGDSLHPLVSVVMRVQQTFSGGRQRMKVGQREPLVAHNEQSLWFCRERPGGLR